MLAKDLKMLRKSSVHLGLEKKVDGVDCELKKI